MKRRKHEYFSKASKLKINKCIYSNVTKLYKQNHDWTCSVACIRTIMSPIKSFKLTEDDIIDKYNLKPGPEYSKDIKRISLLKDYDTIYGTDKKDFTLEDLLLLIDSGYNVMIEGCFNYSHWITILSFFNFNNDPEESIVIIYDPYYDEIKQYRLDELSSMWIDGDYAKSKVKKDFIAVKVK